MATPVGIDAKLTLIAGGLYDITIDDDGDIASEDNFDTAIIVSLFTDRRASVSEVADARYRRGWVGNESNEFEIGSKLFLYFQSRLTNDVLNGVRDAAAEALQWFVDDGLALEIVAAEPVVMPNGLGLDVQIRRATGEVDKRFFKLWNNTGTS